MKSWDIAAICGYITSFVAVVLAPTANGTNPFADALNTLTFGHGSYAITLVAFAGVCAAGVARVIKNRQDAPAKAVTADAVVVLPGTTVVHPTTPSVPLDPPNSIKEKNGLA